MRDVWIIGISKNEELIDKKSHLTYNDLYIKIYQILKIRKFILNLIHKNSITILSLLSLLKVVYFKDDSIPPHVCGFSWKMQLEFSSPPDLSSTKTKDSSRIMLSILLIVDISMNVCWMNEGNTFFSYPVSTGKYNPMIYLEKKN